MRKRRKTKNCGRSCGLSLGPALEFRRCHLPGGRLCCHGNQRYSYLCPSEREIISRACPEQPFSSPCSGFRNTGSHLPPHGLLHLFVDPAGALAGSINSMSKKDGLLSSSDTWPQFQTALDTHSRICRQTAQAFAGARMDTEVGTGA